MKLGLLLTAVIMMNTAVSAKELAILFIGNSMSAAAGGQQELVTAQLRSQGWTIKMAKSYGPGMTLAGHWYNNLGQLDIWRRVQIENKLERLADLKEFDEEYELAWQNEQDRREWFLKRKGMFDAALAQQVHWDFVVLQISGKEPLDPEYYQTHEAALWLLNQIRAHSADTKIILYVPWPYACHEDKVSQYITFRKQMVEQYQLYTSIPIIEARSYARVTRPKLAIHRSPGNHHPGYDGGYLIANLLYIAITGESPVGLPNTLQVAETYDFKGTKFSIATENAQFLQEIAWKSYLEHGLP